MSSKSSTTRRRADAAGRARPKSKKAIARKRAAKAAAGGRKAPRRAAAKRPARPAAKPARKAARPARKAVKPARKAAKPKGKAAKAKPLGTSAKATGKRKAVRRGGNVATRHEPKRRPAKRAKPAAALRRGTPEYSVAEPSSSLGLGLETGGQSGDTMGLSDVERAAAESVADLLQEGQSFEAGIVAGVENAPDADVAEVTTHEVPQDDVPAEYRDQD